MAYVDFLGLDGRSVLVMGVANKKSVAFHTGKVLREAGAKVIWTCLNQEVHDQLRKKLITEEPLLICNVEKQEQIDRMADEVGALCKEMERPLGGLVHSIAFANFSEGLQPFHKTVREDFLQATDISCFSLIAAARALKPHLAEDASVVTISISTREMAAENYGYMAPVKAALSSTVVFLAKSFSADTQVRFNAVCPGLLKTSASAGIPGYIPAYLFAEKATLRKRGLSTGEVANTVAFLLSARSSGINAQGIVIDAGMRTNYFDKDIVAAATRLP
jgi:enoyl-[acyl-carrier protein] reductase I